MRVRRLFAVGVGVAIWLGGLSAASAGATGPAQALEVRRAVADSAILVGPPWATQVEGRVAEDAYLTVNIVVTELDDPDAAGGVVEIQLDLSQVATVVQVHGWTSDCDYSAVDVVTCTVTLPAVDPDTGHVPVPVQAIGLQAAPGAPAGPAGAIAVSWSFNGTPEASTAEIDVVVNAVAATTAPPPTTNPPTVAPPTPTTHPPTTAPTTPPPPVVSKPAPVVIKPAPAPKPPHRVAKTPPPTPTPGVTMTPAPSPQPTPAPPGSGVEALGGNGPAITFGAPAAGGGIWRSPALWLSVGAAAVGLVIASIFAVVSMRRAGRD